MESRRRKLVLALMTTMILLVLAVGALAPGVIARVALVQSDTVQVWDGLEDQLVGPGCGGGSGG